MKALITAVLIVFASTSFAAQGNAKPVSAAETLWVFASVTGMNQEALKAILADVHLGRLVEPDEIAAMIGHCVENGELNATTIEITGGLCCSRGIGK